MAQIKIDGKRGCPSDVVINQGNPQVTASYGTVNSIEISGSGQNVPSLTFIDAGASSVTGDVTLGKVQGAASGDLYFDASTGDGGSTLTIGEKLINHGGLVEIGPSDNTLSAPSTIEAGKLVNRSIIELYGSSTAQATLDIASAAGFGTAGVLTGGVILSGDALIEFRGGPITTIAFDGTLDLIGPHAFVADASDTSSNSALKGLKTVSGELDVEDGATVTTSGPLTLTTFAGLNLESAATVTTSGPLTSSGGIEFIGGSFLNIKGTLTNSASIFGIAGVGTESCTLEAAKVVNHGTITLYGNFENAAVHATLKCGGPFTNDGSVDLSGDTDTIGGAVSGTGDFGLSDASTLEFVHGVSSGETVTFAAGVDHLYLDSPSAFNGTIDDFSRAGDSVIAKGFAEAATMLKYTQTGADSCSWTLTDATHTAVLNFAGEPYAKSDFSISPSANGNVLLKFV